jgi:hypothetical protein
MTYTFSIPGATLTADPDTLDTNLDAETVENLDRIAAGRGATDAYGMYARFKASATRFRLAGQINRALFAERICDKIYAAMPDAVRVW